jgi:hypothetical protein
MHQIVIFERNLEEHKKLLFLQILYDLSQLTYSIYSRPEQNSGTSFRQMLWLRTTACLVGGTEPVGSAACSLLDRWLR